MKFRLKTLFALTAVVSAWLVLARLNPWLPVLVAAMFGPATVAFLWQPSQFPVAAMASPALILSVATAVFFVPSQRLQSGPGNLDAISPLGVSLGFATLPPDWSEFDIEWDIRVAAMYSSRDSRWLHLSLHMLLLVSAAYGIALHLGSLKVGRRKKAA